MERRTYQRRLSTERSEAYSINRTDFEALFEIILTIVTDRRRQFHEGYVTGTQSDVKVRSLQSSIYLVYRISKSSNPSESSSKEDEEHHENIEFNKNQ